MKTLTLALSVLALLGALASAGLYVVIGNTKAELQRSLTASEARATRLSTELAEASEHGESLQRQLNALDADLGDTKSKLTAAEARAVQISRELNQTRTQLTARQEAEQTLTSALTASKRELVQARLAAAQSVSPQEANGLREMIDKLESNVATLQNQLNTRISNANNGSPAPVNAAPAASFSADRSMNARVVTVGPKSAFVILNYGSTNGATLSQELLVRRGADPMARVQISDVRENYSVAQVLPESLQGSLQKGDAAMLVN